MSICLSFLLSFIRRAFQRKFITKETDKRKANIRCNYCLRQCCFFFLSLIDDDPDNTVSIMLDGIESRLHIITIDIDLVCDQSHFCQYHVVFNHCFFHQILLDENHSHG